MTHIHRVWKDYSTIHTLVKPMRYPELYSTHLGLFIFSIQSFTKLPERTFNSICSWHWPWICDSPVSVSSWNWMPSSLVHPTVAKSNDLYFERLLWQRQKKIKEKEVSRQCCQLTCGHRTKSQWGLVTGGSENISNGHMASILKLISKLRIWKQTLILSKYFYQARGNLSS